MVQIINSEPVYRTVCKQCNGILEYTKNDVSINGKNGIPVIICPKCGKNNKYDSKLQPIERKVFMNDFENIIGILSKSNLKYTSIENCEMNNKLMHYIGVASKEYESDIIGIEFNDDYTLHDFYFADGVRSIEDYKTELQENQINPNENYIDRIIRHLKNTEDEKEITEILKDVFVCTQMDSKVRAEFDKIC